MSNSSIKESYHTLRGEPVVAQGAVPHVERYDDLRTAQTPTIRIPTPEGRPPLRGAVSWGTRNDLPGQMIEQVRRNPLLSAAMEFKSMLLCGDGIIPVRRTNQYRDWRYVPCFDYKEVNEFFEENDVNGWFAEQALDQTVFNNAFSALIFNPERTAIETLQHVEAYFSRLEEANPETGEVEHHFLSNQWEQGTPTDVLVSRIVPRLHSVRFLRENSALNAEGVSNHHRGGERRFIVPIQLPSLGHPYYSRAWWQSLADSGWLDFVHEIPEYKRALLKNATVLKYHVKLHPDFWKSLFAKQNVTQADERQQLMDQFFNRLDAFLSNNKNSGLSFISEQYRDGAEVRDAITFEHLTADPQSGGEMLADLEEVSNILAYGMGVHPSLIGASPGKNKSINGTEARELFIIKQGLLAPVRERLLRPLYLIKAFNKWPADLFFRVRNLELTTLDAGTGARRSLGQAGIES